MLLVTLDGMPHCFWNRSQTELDTYIAELHKVNPDYHVDSELLPEGPVHEVVWGCEVVVFGGKVVSHTKLNFFKSEDCQVHQEGEYTILKFANPDQGLAIRWLKKTHPGLLGVPLQAGE